MNNLTLYLLLATEDAAESKARASLDKPIPARPVAACSANVSKSGIYRPSRSDSRTLRQASYRTSHATQHKTPAAEKLVFSAAVVANALGFLTMISGFWLLLQIAQASLA